MTNSNVTEHKEEHSISVGEQFVRGAIILGIILACFGVIHVTS